MLLNNTFMINLKGRVRPCNYNYNSLKKPSLIRKVFFCTCFIAIATKGNSGRLFNKSVPQAYNDEGLKTIFTGENNIEASQIIYYF